MKIALLTDGLWPFKVGGMQKHSYMLCKYLTSNAVRVVVFHPKLPAETRHKVEELFSEVELSFLEWVEVPLPKRFHFPGHYLYESWLYSKKIFTALKDREDVDFIYAQGLTPWYLLQHREAVKQPVGINLHGYEFLQLQADWREKLKAKMFFFPFRFLNRKADYIFSLGGKLSHYIMDLGITDNKIIEIPGAIEKNWIANKERVQMPGTRKLAYLGRFERRKGIQELSRVLPALLEKYNFEFHFIGAIPDSLKLLHPSVAYYGQVTSGEKIIELLDKTDILVCPSYSEGMPIVILEAMARGCSVVASDVGAVNLLVNEKTGWLIKPASEDSLAKALEQAITAPDNELLNKSAAVRELVKKHYTWDIVGKKMVETLEKLALPGYARS